MRYLRYAYSFSPDKPIPDVPVPRQITHTNMYSHGLPAPADAPDSQPIPYNPVRSTAKYWSPTVSGQRIASWALQRKNSLPKMVVEKVQLGLWAMFHVSDERKSLRRHRFASYRCRFRLSSWHRPIALTMRRLGVIVIKGLGPVEGHSDLSQAPENTAVVLQLRWCVISSALIPSSRMATECGPVISISTV